MKYVQKHCWLKLLTCTLEGAISNANQCWIQNTTLPHKFVSPWSFSHVRNGRFPVNQQVHITHSLHNNTNEIPVYWSFKMHCILITWLLPWLLYDKTLKYMKFKKISTPPAPFTSNKHYRSKPTVYGTRNKISARK